MNYGTSACSTPAPTQNINILLSDAINRLGEIAGSTGKLSASLSGMKEKGAQQANAPAAHEPTTIDRVSSVHQLISIIEGNLSEIFSAVG